MQITVKQVKKTKGIDTLISKDLDVLNGKNLFPRKLQQANQMLKKVGLPKI